METTDEDGRTRDRRSETPPRDPAAESDARETARKLAGWTRFVAGVPCFGLFISSLALVIFTTIKVLITTYEGVTGHFALGELAIEYVEFTDLYLLAVVLYIMALGLFSLFITDEIELPSWLVFRDFDDLKERLVSVIIVMLGVHFLGIVLKGASGIDLLWLGVAIGVVIVSLTIFSRLVFKGHRSERPTIPSRKSRSRQE